MASYRDVELVDDDFQTLIDHLPPAYRMIDTDRSWDTSKFGQISSEAERPRIVVPSYAPLLHSDRDTALQDHPSCKPSRRLLCC